MDVRLLNNLPPWEWPEDADAVLLAALRCDQTSEADRILAAELAGDCVVMNDELAAALLVIVASDSESEALRSRAAISFGAALECADLYGFEDPDDVPVSEGMFRKIQDGLRGLAMSADVPVSVRRRVLEGSVRAPQDWHPGLVRMAYGSGDPDWRLTSVFCMRFIRGFDNQIVEALQSPDPRIFREAVLAAGSWELGAAWPVVSALLSSPDTDKELLLAAIEAAVDIRPAEAALAFDGLRHHDDEDICDAVSEALQMAEALDEDDQLW